MHGPPLDSLRPGAVLAGKYTVERVLGAGGMGVVVAARHVVLGHRVAIKVLRGQAFRDPSEARLRFGREARIEAGASHEHIARVFDAGALDDGTPYMVMELLEGETLRDRLAARGALPVAEAIELARQACAGVAAAHDAGVVHRDLNPSNLFVTRRADGRPWVKVLDFGIAKLADAREAGALTASTTLMGTPSYMAPEQMRAARDADARSDVWSLGAILHELVAGVPVFDGATVPEVCAAVHLRAPRPLSSLRAGVPPRLEAIVLRCLAKERSDRYASAHELGLELARVQSEIDLAGMDTVRAFGPPPSHGAVATTSPLRLPATPIASAPPIAMSATGPASRARKRVASVLVPVALIAVLGAITLVRTVASPRTAPPPLASPPPPEPATLAPRAPSASVASAPSASVAPPPAPRTPTPRAPTVAPPRIAAPSTRAATAPSAAPLVLDAGPAPVEAWPWGERQ